MSLLPWGEMLRASLRLGITPQVFWQLSLKEWRLLAGQEAHGAMGRAQLQSLIDQFPDEKTRLSEHD